MQNTYNIKRKVISIPPASFKKSEIHQKIEETIILQIDCRGKTCAAKVIRKSCTDHRWLHTSRNYSCSLRPVHWQPDLQNNSIKKRRMTGRKHKAESTLPYTVIWWGPSKPLLKVQTVPCPMPLNRQGYYFIYTIRFRGIWHIFWRHPALRIMGFQTKIAQMLCSVVDFVDK